MSDKLSDRTFITSELSRMLEKYINIFSLRAKRLKRNWRQDKMTKDKLCGNCDYNHWDARLNKNGNL